ncbi:MAG: hypothetical protein J7L37_05920 [Thermococcus sp.]|nr:hypothetical protein [Thermococcus sp.]
MGEPVKDSVEAALELNEKEVYSHIAHESAEDIIRIISSLDAERAKLHGEVIYYRDDWDDLIRERLAKGKRHTAFDFYNPALFEIWERKVKEARKIRWAERLAYIVFGGAVLAAAVASALSSTPYILPVAAALPILVLIRDRSREKLDLIYYELTQFFIDELRVLLKKYSLPPEKYRFKIFSGGYFGVSLEKKGTGIAARIKSEKV